MLASPGVTGVAVDPAFATNRFVYLYYTRVPGGPGTCVNRVSRFSMGNASRIDPTSEVVLLDNLSRTGVDQNVEWLRQTHGSRVHPVIADLRQRSDERPVVIGEHGLFRVRDERDHCGGVAVNVAPGTPPLRLRRHAAGDNPVSRLKARLKAASDS